MITPLLEKLILNNKAVYAVHTHACSSFGSIPIPKGKLVVLTSITWNYFFNPYGLDAVDMDAASAELYGSEYMLKIESAKGAHYFIYRNGWRFNLMEGQDGTTMVYAILASNANPVLFKEPDKRDVYITCVDYIKISVLRILNNEGLVNTAGVLNATANEEAPPNGLSGLSMNLRTRFSLGVFTYNLTPAGNEMSGQATQARNYQSYQGEIRAEAILFPPAGDRYNTRTQPLIQLDMVTVNSNEYSDMINR